MNEEFKKSIKSSETEDWIDYHIIRPYSYRWAKFYNRFGISPNSVTILSMIIGAASAFFFAQGSYYYDPVPWRGIVLNLVAFVLLTWAEIFDCADGQLARISGKRTRSGRILDGIAGYAWYIPIYAALIYRFYRHHSIEFGWLGIADTDTAKLTATAIVTAITALSGWCLASQQRLADYYLQVHLFFLKGEAGSELHNSEQQREIYENMTSDNPLWERLFQKSYIGYTRRQERITPRFQRLMRLLRQKYGTVENIPQDVRSDIHDSSLRLMKLNDMLTFNFRTFYLFVFCMLDVPVLAFLFEIIVMSILQFCVNRRHEAFCKRISGVVSGQ